MWIVLGVVGIVALCGLVVGGILLWNALKNGNGSSYSESARSRNSRRPTPPGTTIPGGIARPLPDRPAHPSRPTTRLGSTTWNGQRAEAQLRLLTDNGYCYSDLRVFDNDENTYYIAVPCDKVTVHFIYDTAHPDSPPLTLVSEKSKLNNFGEITDKQVDVNLTTLAQWENGHSLLDIVNEVRQNLRQGYTLNEHGEVIWRRKS